MAIKTYAYEIKHSHTLDDIFKDHFIHKIELGGSALYLKPNNIDVETDSASVLSIPIDTFFRWGFQIDANYFFNDTKNIHIEWLHYENGIQDNILLAKQINLARAVPINHGYTSDFDIINLDIGQWIVLNNGLSFRLSAGAEYADINIDYNYDFVTVFLDSYDFSKEHGYQLLGVRVGLDLDYAVWRNIDLVINSAVVTVHRFGDYHYRHVTSDNNANDIDVSSKMNGVIFGTDIEALVTYRHRLMHSELLFTGGARAIVYLKEKLSWSGATCGIKVLGNL